MLQEAKVVGSFLPHANALISSIFFMTTFFNPSVPLPLAARIGFVVARTPEPTQFLHL